MKQLDPGARPTTYHSWEERGRERERVRACAVVVIVTYDHHPLLLLIVVSKRRSLGSLSLAVDLSVQLLDYKRVLSQG